MMFDLHPHYHTVREYRVDDTGHLYSVPVGVTILHGKLLTPAPCMCVVMEDVKTESGPVPRLPEWRPCPPDLCELEGHDCG